MCTVTSVSGPLIPGLEGDLASTAERIVKGFHSTVNTTKNLSTDHQRFIHSNNVYLPFCVHLEINPFQVKQPDAPQSAPHYAVLSASQHELLSQSGSKSQVQVGSREN